jgi:hypothetical protein
MTRDHAPHPRPVAGLETAFTARAWRTRGSTPILSDAQTPDHFSQAVIAATEAQPGGAR